MNPDLSIIVLSYNTKDITKKTLELLYCQLTTPIAQIKFEIIVIDNSSTDGSLSFLHSFFSSYSNIRIIGNSKNIGFAKANNQGIKEAKGRYILFLNSDVHIESLDFDKLISYMEVHQRIGVLTVKVYLPNGKIDPASHRGFPSVWRSFCYYSKLEKVMKIIPPFRKIFCGYHLLDKDFSEVHEIDSPSGAFFLTRKEILNKIGGFDEDFFMYGEDLDLSFRIKKQRYLIIYYPHASVIHLKYQSGLQKNTDERKKVQHYFYNAMLIFYKKHYLKKYPFFINAIVLRLIDFRIHMI